MNSISSYIFRYSVYLLSGTFLCRLSGMVREILLAFFFGASPTIAAFLISYRLALTINAFLGEKLWAQCFIPHFEEIRQSSSNKEAFKFFRDVFFLFLCFIFLLILIFEIVLFVLYKKNIVSSSFSHVIVRESPSAARAVLTQFLFRDSIKDFG